MLNTVKLSQAKFIFFGVFFTCLHSFVQAQLVGIHQQTIAVSPSYTVSNNTTITVTGKVQNKGLTDINNNVHVHLAIDTSSSNVPKYYLRVTRTYSMASFLAGQTFTFTLTDVASVANFYKGGDGSTIVVWATVGPITNPSTTADTANTTIYIIDVPQGVSDLNNFEKHPIYFNNPAKETIHLNYDETIYTKLELNDISGKYIFDVYNKTLNINELPQGLYLLRFYNEKKNRYISKKIIIQ